MTTQLKEPRGTKRKGQKDRDGAKRRERDRERQTKRGKGPEPQAKCKFDVGPSSLSVFLSHVCLGRSPRSFRAMLSLFKFDSRKMVSNTGKEKDRKGIGRIREGDIEGGTKRPFFLEGSWARPQHVLRAKIITLGHDRSMSQDSQSFRRSPLYHRSHRRLKRHGRVRHIRILFFLSLSSRQGGEGG